MAGGVRLGACWLAEGVRTFTDIYGRLRTCLPDSRQTLSVNVFFCGAAGLSRRRIFAAGVRIRLFLSVKVRTPTAFQQYPQENFLKFYSFLFALQLYTVYIFSAVSNGSG